MTSRADRCLDPGCPRCNCRCICCRNVWNTYFPVASSRTLLPPPLRALADDTNGCPGGSLGSLGLLPALEDAASSGEGELIGGAPATLATSRTLCGGPSGRRLEESEELEAPISLWSLLSGAHAKKYITWMVKEGAQESRQWSRRSQSSRLGLSRGAPRTALRLWHIEGRWAFLRRP